MDEKETVKHDEEELEHLEQEIEAARHHVDDPEKKAHDLAPKFWEEGEGGPLPL